MNDSVSILISNFNRGFLFDESIQSIIPQLKVGDEIVVADDTIGGQDEVMKRVLELATSKYGIKTKYLYLNNDHYRSSCYAKNVALKNSSNNIIIINDPEVIHISECIKQIKETLKEQPRAFIVPSTMYFPNQDQALDLGYLDQYRKMEKSQAPFIGGVMKVELIAVGGWDERFKFWGNDDNDLMHRLGQNNAVHLVHPDMVALHQWHDRPPREALGDFNEPLLYEDRKPVVANMGKEWGKL